MTYKNRLFLINELKIVSTNKIFNIAFLVLLVCSCSCFAQNKNHASVKTNNRSGSRRVYTYYNGQATIPNEDAPPILNRSWIIYAYLEIPSSGAEGVIVADGGNGGGYALYVKKDGRLNFVYNYLAKETFNLVDKEPLPPGKVRVEIVFEYKGKSGELGKGAKVKMYINNVAAAEREIPRTIPDEISLKEGLNIGMDTGSPVDHAYKQPFAFTGTINKITMALK
jgi:arylsulfatase